MTEYHVFDCGCKIPIIDGHPQIDFDDLNYECGKTWDLYCKGHTQSVFQLESYVGKKWSAELKPRGIEDAAALAAIIRPGTANAVDENGVSLTKVFCDRKNGISAVDEKDPLYEYTKDTQCIQIYQETILTVCREVGQLSNKSQAKLLKALGKKSSDILLSLRKEFIEGAVRSNKLTEEQASAVFDNIEAAGRYSFNKCILGSQKLKQLSKGKHKFHPTVEELYKITTDIKYAKKTGHISLYKKHKLNKCFGFALSMCDDGRIRKNKIVNIQEAGVQQCYIIETESGKSCQVTIQHKFPTPNGDKMVCELSVGDDLFICDNYEKNDSRKYKFSNYSTEEIRYIRKNGGGKIPHGNFKLFRENKEVLVKANNVCAQCCNYHKRLELHHVNGDRSQNNIENLKLLCPSCHKKEEYKNGRIKRGEKGFPTKLEKIKSITLGNVGMTYDITMEAPNHNYITEDNIVTCNSHAVGYAVVGYQTAWVKAHLPKHYICAWLRISQNESKPLEEIRAMISEGHRLQIPIVNPSVKNLPETRFFIKNGTVYFGISSIKNCGESAFKKIAAANVDLSKCGWLEFLVLHSSLINKRQLISMIRAGCFDYTGFSRMYCEYQFEQWDQVTKGQKNRIVEYYKNAPTDKLEELLDSFIKNTKQSKNDGSLKYILDALINPSMDLYDSPNNIIAHEKELMGINLSCSKIKRANIPESKDSCRSVDNKSHHKYKKFVLVGEINEYKEFKIKRGKLVGQIMANFKLVDDTGECEIVAFQEQVDLFQSALYDGNVVLILGAKSNRGGLILDVCHEV